MRPFLEAMHDLLGEERLDRFTAQLAEVTQEVMMNRGKGSITLTVSISPNGENALKVNANLKTTCPQPSFGERIVYATANGDILRENPNQHKLPLGPRLAAAE